MERKIAMHLYEQYSATPGGRNHERRRVRFSRGEKSFTGTLVAELPTMIDDKEAIIYVISSDDGTGLVYQLEGPISDA